MKKLIPGILSLLLVVLFVSCGGSDMEGTFALNPENPQAGKIFEVMFNPEGTDLEDSDSVELYYYEFILDGSKAKSLEMEQDGDIWKASVVSNPGALAMGFKFTDGTHTESNDKKGYLTVLHDENGAPLKGAEAGLAQLSIDWSFSIGTRRSLDEKKAALATLEKEFNANPQLKKDYMSFYFYLVRQVERDRGKERILNEAKTMENNPDLSEDQLYALTSNLKRFEQEDKAKEYERLLELKNPSHNYFAIQGYREFRGLKTENEKIDFIREYASKFKDSPYLSRMHNSIILKYAREGDEQAASAYFREFPKAEGPDFYTAIANTYMEKTGSITKAVNMALKAIETAREDLKKVDNLGKPEYMVDAEWQEYKNKQLANSLFTYATALTKGNLSKSAIVEAMEEAVELTKGEDLEMNTAYVEALANNGLVDKGYSVAENFIKEGNATEKMFGSYRDLYMKKEGSEQGFNEHLAELRKIAKDNLIKEVERELVNYAAPKFNLKNLEGENITKESLNGKIVIVDFWATWCPPCRASFPTMKKAVEKYQTNKDVQFYFVNTGDYEEDRVNRIKKFLADRECPFDVLLDREENRLSDAFKVEGIPTKFFLDKNGNVRYSQIGWSGNDQEELEKTDILIEMLSAE